MDVAIVEYHSGDEYQTNAAIARLNYYNIGSFPTTKFDGVLSSVGGGSNLYPSYLQKYNSRIAIPSSYTIEVQGTNSGMEEYELEITIEKVADGIDNPIMQVAVTESHIPDFWGGLPEVNFAMRLMAPNHNGTTLDFSDESIEEKSISFTMDPDWVNENCELVVFLQNNSTKEILQGVKYDIMDFVTTNMNDAAITDLEIPKTLCNDAVVAQVMIANYGLENLSSLDLSLDVNGSVVSTITWTGDLENLGSELVVFPEVNITIEPSNSFEVIVDNPNGQDDEYPSNDSYLLTVNEAPSVAAPVSLVMLLGSNPEEITWEVKNSQGEVLYEGGPYSGTPSTVIQEFELLGNDCYSFIIYDVGGDGLTGGGVYKLYNGDNTVFMQGNDYGMQDHVQFEINYTGEEEFVAGNSMEIYPNPTDQKAQVSIEILESQVVEMEVFNSVGSKVYATGKKSYSAGKHRFELDGEGFPSGIYYVSMKIGDRVEVQKLIIR